MRKREINYVKISAENSPNEACDFYAQGNERLGYESLAATSLQAKRLQIYHVRGNEFAPIYIDGVWYDDLKTLSGAEKKSAWKDRALQLLAQYLVRRVKHCKGEPAQRFKKLTIAASAFNLLQKASITSVFFTPEDRAEWDSLFWHANWLSGFFESDELKKCFVEINELFAQERKKSKPSDGVPVYIWEHSDDGWLGYESIENGVRIFRFRVFDTGDVYFSDKALNCSWESLNRLASEKPAGIADIDTELTYVASVEKRLEWKNSILYLLANYLCWRLDHCKRFPAERFAKLKIAAAAFNFFQNPELTSPVFSSEARLKWENLRRQALCTSLTLLESRELEQCFEAVERQLTKARHTAPAYPGAPVYLYDNPLNEWFGYESQQVGDQKRLKIFCSQLNGYHSLILHSFELPGYSYADLKSLVDTPAADDWQSQALKLLAEYLILRLAPCDINIAHRYDKLVLAINAFNLLKNAPVEEGRFSKEMIDKWNALFGVVRGFYKIPHKQQLTTCFCKIECLLIDSGKIVPENLRIIYSKSHDSLGTTFEETICCYDSYDHDTQQKCIVVKFQINTPKQSTLRDQVNIVGYNFAELKAQAEAADEHWKVQAIAKLCAYLHDRLNVSVMDLLIDPDKRMAKIKLAVAVLNFLKTLPDNAAELTAQHFEQLEGYCVSAVADKGKFFTDYLNPICQIISAANASVVDLAYVSRAGLFGMSKESVATAQFTATNKR